MPVSDSQDVRNMYDATAGDYDRMMDAEIELPMYADVLGRLRDRILGQPGILLDAACGSGHMLERYHERYEPTRPLVGVDLSPEMVAIAAERLGDAARIVVGDMRHLAAVGAGSCRAVLCFFAIHHLDADDVRVALGAWHRVLVEGGQLVMAAWEGQGTIDYGDAADLVAVRYSADELDGWMREAGFDVTRRVVEPVDDMPMDAVYFEGVRRAD